MSDDLSQYKDLYLQTSREYLQSLNQSLLKLEKNQTDSEAIDEVFRSAHSLKSQSAAMGYEQTGFLCHTIEDVFYEIKQGHLTLSPELADKLFKAFDDLAKSIDTIEKSNTESDLKAQAEELKRQTGVTTVGAGKSKRDGQPQVMPPLAPTTTNPPKIQTVELPITPQKIKTITLPVEQLDTLLNLIEGLTIHHLRLRTFMRQAENAEVVHQYDQATKILQNLQYEIMKARLIPVSVVFDHFPRTVRDLARAEHKEVALKILDDNLAIDRAIVERLDEPLIHLLRNAVSHGIEKAGTITITTKKDRGWAVTSIHNEGRAIDWEKLKRLHAKAGLSPDASPKELLFAGISTADVVTSISGRGVGMKAVKETIENFGGQIDVESNAEDGTTFTLRFPLSLAISKALLVVVGQATYALPVNAIERIVRIPPESLKISANQEVTVLDKIEVPLIRLEHILGRNLEVTSEPRELIVVVTIANTEKVGLVVTKLIDALDIAVKPLPEALQGNRLLSGTTILEDGQSVLVLNLQTLAEG